jgi:hypothetical protein
MGSHKTRWTGSESVAILSKRTRPTYVDKRVCFLAPIRSVSAPHLRLSDSGSPRTRSECGFWQGWV